MGGGNHRSSAPDKGMVLTQAATLKKIHQNSLVDFSTILAAEPANSAAAEPGKLYPTRQRYRHTDSSLNGLSKPGIRWF